MSQNGLSLNHLNISEKIQGPTHLGIIPDGNRRWAKLNNIKVEDSHHFGLLRTLPLLEELFRSSTTKVYTVWGFSTENMNRPLTEVKALFRVMRVFIPNFVELAHKYNCSFRRIGNTSKLPGELVMAIKQAEADTAQYTERIFYIAINYGGRWDVANAVNSFITQHPGKLITPKDISNYISLSNEGIPEPELIIRSGSDSECKRTSGFLSWQSEYTEFYFSPKLFPDITMEDIVQAFAAYRKTNRKFGE